MISQTILNLKFSYKNGPDDIGRDFISPCISECKLYRRGTGFFSSSALAAYAEAIDAITEGRTKVQIVCSPVVQDKTVLEVLKRNLSESQRLETIRQLSDQVVLLAMGYKMNPDRREYRSKLLAYFIATGALEIRFAVPKNFSDPTLALESEGNLYHVKTGYFNFGDDFKLGFSGSFNESGSGHHFHVDETQVFKSWEPRDAERLEYLISQVDADWNNQNPYLKIYEMGPEALELARRLSPDSRPRKPIDPKKLEEKHHEPPPAARNPILEALRDYQQSALKSWSDADHRGILAMATGTGKTRTALAAIQAFRINYPSSLVAVTVPYVPLAHQWSAEFSSLNIETIKVFETVDSWRDRVMNLIQKIAIGGSFLSPPPVLVCVNKTFKDTAFQGVIELLHGSLLSHMLVVDECHHFNDVESVKKLPKVFSHRLGLSATPYDDDGVFMDAYFGDIVFEFELKRAIERGYLTPYRYHPIFIELTNEEAKEYERVTLSARSFNNSGPIDASGSGPGSMSLSQRAILDSAIGKSLALREVVERTGRMKHCLFYCGVGNLTLSDGERVRNLTVVAKLLTQMGWNIGRVTAEEQANDRERILNDFKDGDLDALVSIRVLDEGIDIPACHTAFILASQDSVRQGVQRRGRVLRLAEGKSVADLYDFIFTGPFFRDADIDKLYDRELRRAKLFAADALNCEDSMKRILSKF